MNILKPTCNKCGRIAPIDKEKSNSKWVVYKTHKPCECGGQFIINFEK